MSLAAISLAHPGDVENIVVASLKGQIDESNLPEISSQLDPLVTQVGLEKIILNLKELEFLNSKVIGYLADFHSRTEEGGKRLVIAEASDSVIDILELVGLTSLIACYPSNESAIQDLA